MNDFLHFDTIKEHRGSYFVEYKPPIATINFASLDLVFLQRLPWEEISNLLDQEIRGC
jgi:hypothetical protein